MPLHCLKSATIGVPNVAEVAEYYRDFGLTEVAPGRFASVDGGEQLVIERSASRRLLALEIGVDDPDDLARVTSQLSSLDLETRGDSTSLTTRDPVADVRVTLTVSPRLRLPETAVTPYNAPGRAERTNKRAPFLSRTDPVRPRKLGHVVIGSVDMEASERFFIDGLGFKVSDVVKGGAAFMRCSTDHHNVLVQRAPVNFLHHTSWEVEDVDEVGRGGKDLLAGHPERHVWGLGRHNMGSCFFWYFKDPAGNFSEYYSDMDCIVDDQLWEPRVFEVAELRAAMFNDWAPPMPRSFMQPEDVLTEELVARMTGAHQSG